MIYLLNCNRDNPRIICDFNEGDYGLQKKVILSLVEKIVDYFDIHGLKVNVFLDIVEKDSFERS